MEGILPVHKTRGWTSHDVVAKVRKILGVKRIGHTGTLDPEASGVLPLCIGRATRMVEYLQELPKEYEVVMKFGLSTDTEDMTGNIVEKAAGLRLDEQEIRRAAQQFVGEIEQVPPMYSAVKVGGKKLYELARSGQSVERLPRKVVIYQLDILHVHTADDYPEMTMRVRCSKGTYIRTLCVDIGKALNVPAVMKQLTRTAAGNIRLHDCLFVEEVERLYQGGRLAEKILPVDQAVAHFPSAVVGKDAVRKALSGNALAFHQLSGVPSAGGLLRLYAPSGSFLGIFAVHAEKQEVVPVKVFS
jgi:tRNA pseudouridine55 synthase